MSTTRKVRVRWTETTTYEQVIDLPATMAIDEDNRCDSDIEDELMSQTDEDTWLDSVVEVTDRWIDSIVEDDPAAQGRLF